MDRVDHAILISMGLIKIYLNIFLDWRCFEIRNRKKLNRAKHILSPSATLRINSVEGT